MNFAQQRDSWKMMKDICRQFVSGIYIVQEVPDTRGFSPWSKDQRMATDLDK